MEAPHHINLEDPKELTQAEKRKLARLYHEARVNGDTIPGLTVRHIGQEAWVAANQSAPANRIVSKEDHELSI